MNVVIIETIKIAIEIKQTMITPLDCDFIDINVLITNTVNKTTLITALITLPQILLLLFNLLLDIVC